MRSARPVLVSGLLVALLLSSSATALFGAQPPSSRSGIGVVTALQGRATVARQSLPQPGSLHFKDDVFYRDEIATKERSTVRLLLGGKGVLTIREQSQVTLDESVAPDGGHRSVLSLLAGKIGAAIARTLMRPGEVIDIRTPNAVGAVRGTVFIVEYIPPKQSAAAAPPVLLASSVPGPFLAQAGQAAGGQSNFIVLSGSVTVTPQGQPPVTVGAMQSVSVTTGAAGTQVGAVQTITPAQAAEAAQGLDAGKPHTGEAEGSRTAQAQAQVAAALATALLEATGVAPPPTEQTQAGQSTNTTTTVTGAGIVPPVTTTTTTATTPVTPPLDYLPEGPALSLNNVTLGVAAGTSLATFDSGAPSATSPLTLSGAGGGDVIVVNGPVVKATGTTITHSGALFSLSGSAVVGAETDTTTPLVKITGTSVTNSGGPLFSLGGASAVTTFGPLVGLEAATAELAGVMTIAGGSEVALGPADAIVVPTGTGLTLTSPAFDVTDGSLATYSGGDLLFTDPATLILQAPILSVTGHTAALSGSVLHTVDTTVNASTAGASLVALDGGTLTLSGKPLLDSAGSTLSFAGAAVDLKGSSTLESTAAGVPLFKMSGGSLSATSLIAGDGTGNALKPTGPLLDLSGGADVNLSALLSLSGSDSHTHSLGANEPYLKMSSGSKLTLRGTDPLVTFSKNMLTATSAGIALQADLSTLNVGGPLLKLEGSAGALSLTASNPQVQLADTTVKLAEGVSVPLVQATGGDPVTLSGPLLKAANLFLSGAAPSPALVSLSGATLTTGGALLDLGGTSMDLDLGNLPLMMLGGGSSLATTAGPIFKVSDGKLQAATLLKSDGTGNTVELTGSLLDLSNGASLTLATLMSGSADSYAHTLAANEPFIKLAGSSTLTITGADPLVTFSADLFPCTGSGCTPTSAGVALRSDSGAISVNGPLLKLDGNAGAFNLTASNPQIQLTDTTVTLNSQAVPLTQVSGGGTVSLSGPLLEATNLSLTTTPSPALVSLSGATLSGGAPLVDLGGTSMELNLGNTPVVAVGNGSSLTTTTGPVFKVSDGNLQAPALLQSDGSGNNLTLKGPLLDLESGATLTLAKLTDLAAGDTYTHTLVSNEPYVQVVGSTLTLTGSDPLVTFNASILPSGSSAGVTLIAQGSGTLNLGGPLLLLDGADLNLAATAPQIQLTNTTINLNGHVSSLVQFGDTYSSASVTLGGSLFKATNLALLGSPPTQALVSLFGSTLTVSGQLLDLDGASTTLSIGVPLVSVQPNYYETSSYLENIRGPVFKIGGGTVQATTLVEDNGWGTTLNLRGTLLELSNGANVTLGTLTNISGKYTHTLDTNQPYVMLAGGPAGSSSLTLTGMDPLVAFRADMFLDSTSTGVALIANDSNLTLNAPLLTLGTGCDCSPLSLTATDPQVQLTGATVTLSDRQSFIAITAGGASVDGPLLTASYTTLEVGGPLLRLDGSSLYAATSTDQALLQFTGGKVTITDPTGASGLVDLRTGSSLDLTGGTMDVGGPLLSASGTTFNLTGPLLSLSDPTRSFNSPYIWSNTATDRALLQFGPGTQITASALVYLRDGSTLDLTYDESGPGDPLLNATGTTFTLRGPVVSLQGESKLVVGAGPVFSMSGGKLDASALLYSDGSGNTVNLTGTLLNLSDGANVTFGSLTSIGSGGNFPDTYTHTLGTNEPYIQLSGGSSLTVTGTDTLVSFTGCVGECTATEPGVALLATDSTLTLGGGGPLLALGGMWGYLSLTATNPQIQLTNTTVSSFGGQPLIAVTGGSNISLMSEISQYDYPNAGDWTGTYVPSGPLLTASGATTLRLSGPLLKLEPYYYFDGTYSGVYGSSLSALTEPGHALLQFSDSTVTMMGSAGTSPLVHLSGSDLSVGGVANSQYIGGIYSSTYVASGPLLSASNTTFTLGGPLLKLDAYYDSFADSYYSPSLSALTAPDQALLQFNGGSVSITDPTGTSALVDLRTGASLDLTGGTGTVGGPLLSASGTTFNLTGPLLSLSDPSGSFNPPHIWAIKTATDQALLQFGTGTQITASALVDLRDGSALDLTYDESGPGVGGPLLSATGTTFTFGNGTGPVVSLQGGSSLIVGTGPVFRMSGGTLQASALLRSDGTYNTINLTGTLLDLSAGANVTLDSVLAVGEGDTYTHVLAANEAYVSVSGDSHLSSATNAALTFLSGDPTHVDGSGLGTDQLLQGAPSQIISLSNSTPDDLNPNINLTGSGSLFKLDTALLNASAAVVAAVNSAIAVNGGTDGGLVFNKSNVTLGAGVWLDNSILRVNNGPLLNVTGGTTMTVNGDLASLMNGSKILVQNGPMISVNGTGSTLTINGALVNFQNSHPNNQVVINNNIQATRVDTSSNVAIPVYEATGGAVSITNPTVVKNSTNGIFSVTCTTGCAPTNPASVIQATGGGKVTIK